jgi:hypothetical protein
MFEAPMRQHQFEPLCISLVRLVVGCCSVEICHMIGRFGPRHSAITEHKVHHFHRGSMHIPYRIAGWGGLFLTLAR